MFYAIMTYKLSFIIWIKYDPFYNWLLQNAEDKDFDTTIQGPWMKKWDLVNHNTHTAKMDDDVKSTWHAQQVKA